MKQETKMIINLFDKRIGKRGDVPIYILILGVFAVCGLLLLSFSISSGNFKNKFLGLEILGKINSYGEEFQFYKSPAFSKNSDQIIQQFNQTYIADFKPEGKIYYKIMPSETGGCILRGTYREKSSFLGFGGEWENKIIITRIFN